MKYKFTLLIILILTIHTQGFSQIQDKYQKFHTAAYEGDYRTAYNLIKEGINIDSTDYDGITALMYASQAGHIKIVNLLLDNYADVNIKPYDGKGALIAAVRAGEFDIAELLIRNDANINDADYYELTPLLYAVSNNDYNITDMLLYYEADPNICDEDGYSTLSIASIFGNDSIAYSLILAGANSNIQDSLGYSPLMFACQNGFEYIVQILISSGCDVNLRNKQGFTSLHIASIYGYPDIVRMLLDTGSDITRTNKSDLTAYALARSNKHSSTSRILRKSSKNKLKKPVFDKFIFSLENSFSRDDYITGMRFGLHELYSGTSLNLGYGFRVKQIPVLIKESENLFFQYWEKRHILYLGLEHKFYLSSNYKYKIGLVPNIKEVFSFGSYSGTNDKPNSVFVTSPSIGLFYTEDFLTFQFDYQHLEFNITGISPHRFNLSILFDINLIYPKYTFIDSNWF